MIRAFDVSGPRKRDVRRQGELNVRLGAFRRPAVRSVVACGMRHEIVLTPKFFRTLSVSKLGDRPANSVSRPGTQSAPGPPGQPRNARRAAPCWSRLADQGLLPARNHLFMDDPGAADVEPFVCWLRRRGVPRLELGFSLRPETYWALGWPPGAAPGKPSRKVATRSRRPDRVTSHSGPVLGSNCAGMMHPVCAPGPEVVGAYRTFGNDSGR